METHISTSRLPLGLPNRDAALHAQERLVRGIIIGGGILCFCLLAWVHLGIAAYFFPPAPTIPQQVAHTDGYTVTLALSSGQLTAAGPNTLAITIDGADHQPIIDASVQARLVMTTMGMDAPTVSATLGSYGQYLLHPKFAMAGIWRVSLAFTRPDGVAHAVTFLVGVRWN